MLKIIKQHDLGQYTTIGINQKAEFFAVLKRPNDIFEAIAWSKQQAQPLFILGGGSNILLASSLPGLALKNETKGMRVVKETASYALVEAASGESWSKFVSFAVRHGYYGAENLFLIYGTVGAAPVQNIGAYGVELKDIFHSLKAIDLKSGKEKIFSKAQCQFGYRDSVFKGKYKGKYFIASVTLKLSRKPNFRLDYGAIRQKLAERGVSAPKLTDVVRAIGEIRRDKLPDPYQLPNSGSFFKNPTVSLIVFKRLVKKYPDLPSFPAGKGRVKLPAGWLIEQAGYKGKAVGPVRMYEKQALILVNSGQATAKDALKLVRLVQAAVRRRFGVDLEPEVNII